MLIKSTKKINNLIYYFYEKDLFIHANGSGTAD